MNFELRSISLETFIDLIYNEGPIESSISLPDLVAQPSLDQPISGPSGVLEYLNEPERTPNQQVLEPIINNDIQQLFEHHELAAAEDQLAASPDLMISDDPVLVLLPLTTEIINKPSEVPANNYLKKIASLVNTGRNSNLKGALGISRRYQIPLAWQCIGPDGKIWDYIELQDYLKDERNEFIRLKNFKKCPSGNVSPDYAYCLLEGCNCGFKLDADPGLVEVVIEQIIRHLGVIFYCTLCSFDNQNPVASMANVRKHFARCPFAPRALAEAETVLSVSTAWMESRWTRPVDYISIREEDFDSRFLGFLKRVHQLALKRALFGPTTIESLFPDIQKSPNLSSIVQVFSDYERSHPTGSKFKVNMMEDTFFIIQYHVPELIYDHCSKIFKFQIVERKKQKAVSIWRIEKATTLPEDKKCNYPECPCGNEFTTEDEDFFAGHILKSNFLVVCCKCSFGFMLWDDFENHLFEDCLTERNMKLGRYS